jgi:hypothetical protein
VIAASFALAKFALLALAALYISAGTVVRSLAGRQ